jgi:hypothetical protein
VTPVEVALAYARIRGLPVFPVSNDGRKVPLIQGWPNAASTDPAVIIGWWRQFPWALIAMPTGKRSGLVVLDIDIKHADANGFDTLEALGKGYFPDTPMAQTPSGGLHVYFAVNPRADIRNSVGKHGLGPGLDVRGSGGQIVLPGAGSGYTWDPHWNFTTVAPEVAPAWLGHRVKKRHSGHQDEDRDRRFDPKSIPRRACERIRTAPDGEKHSTLNGHAFRVGCLVGDRFLSRGEAWDDLCAATASLISHSDAHRQRTWATLQRAFGDGLNAPRRARR